MLQEMVKVSISDDVTSKIFTYVRPILKGFFILDMNFYLLDDQFCTSSHLSLRVMQETMC